MLWLENCDVSAARQHLQRFEQMLRTDSNSGTVRQAVTNIARVVDPDGSAVREVALPTISGITLRGTPASREPNFDEAVEKFIVWFYNRCDQIEEWQQKQRANVALSRATVRQSVIRHAAHRSDDLQWLGEIQFEMCLSQSQIRDAVEYLSRRGAVEIGSENSTGDGEVIMNFRVTPEGRDLAHEPIPTIAQNVESRKHAMPEFGSELERIKDEFSKLAVKDEANRARLLNELETVITLSFGSDGARYIKQSRNVLFYPQVLFSDGGADYTPQTWSDGQAEMAGIIESIKHHLSMIARPEPEATSVARILPATNKVFIVHGHDKAMRSDVEAFVTRLGLDAIILMEEANRGRTLLEKFEAHAEAAYAVVLLSPDDVGRSAAVSASDEKLRPRQNVVLELGYFIGRLGRGRVAAIVDQDRDNQVEYPSDIRGIATVPYSHTNGDWKRLLAKEFRAAALPFDESRV